MTMSSWEDDIPQVILSILQAYILFAPLRNVF